MNSAAALMLAISSASSEAKWPFKMVCSRSCLCRSSPFGFDMDVHPIGGPQRSAKSVYSTQSPFNRDRQLLADPRKFGILQSAPGSEEVGRGSIN
jgi:hypothetical protein